MAWYPQSTSHYMNQPWYTNYIKTPVWCVTIAIFCVRCRSQKTFIFFFAGKSLFYGGDAGPLWNMLPNEQSIVLHAKLSKDSGEAKVTLAAVPGVTSQDTYEIIIQNGNCELKFNGVSNDTFSFDDTNTLSISRYFTFWISWKQGMVEVGSGPTVGLGRFLGWRNPNPVPIRALMVNKAVSWRFDSESGRYFKLQGGIRCITRSFVWLIHLLQDILFHWYYPTISKFLVINLPSRHVWTWWRHQMETFSALLSLCEGSQRPVMLSFGVFFGMRLKKLLSKQSRCWWFETPWRSLWSHCNVSDRKYEA